MNIFSKIFVTTTVKKTNGSFADFFINAPEKEKLRVFKQAAKQANEDQRKTVGLTS
jgi:histone H3/H4